MPESAITVLDVIKELDGDVPGIGGFDTPQEEIDRSELDMTKLVENFEKNIIRYACEKHGSTRKAAKALGISQTQIVRKKNKYDL